MKFSLSYIWLYTLYIYISLTLSYIYKFYPHPLLFCSLVNYHFKPQGPGHSISFPELTPPLVSPSSSWPFNTLPGDSPSFPIPLLRTQHSKAGGPIGQSQPWQACLGVDWRELWSVGSSTDRSIEFGEVSGNQPWARICSRAANVFERILLVELG